MKRECKTCDNYCPYSVSEGTCKVFGPVNEEGFIEYSEYGSLHVKSYGSCAKWRHRWLKVGWKLQDMWVGAYLDDDYVYLILIPTLYLRIRRKERVLLTDQMSRVAYKFNQELFMRFIHMEWVNKGSMAGDCIKWWNVYADGETRTRVCKEVLES